MALALKELSFLRAASWGGCAFGLLQKFGGEIWLIDF
jgi:hypothetical protein